MNSTAASAIINVMREMETRNRLVEKGRKRERERTRTTSTKHIQKYTSIIKS